MQAFGQHAADDDSEREEVLEGLNFFGEQDEDDVDDEPGHRAVEPIEDFDLVEDEDEDGRLGTSRPEPALAPDALSQTLFHHHGMRANALHMKTVWRDVVTEGDSPAISAPLADKSTIICRTGMLMLASGTGAWRVRDTMDRVASHHSRGPEPAVVRMHVHRGTSYFQRGREPAHNGSEHAPHLDDGELPARD